MTDIDYDELAKIKHEVVARFPREDKTTFWLFFVFVTIASAAALSAIAFVATKIGSDPLLVSVIAGLSVGCGAVVSFAIIATLKANRLQRHLITLHEELLTARAEIRRDGKAEETADPGHPQADVRAG